ncbi:MAG: hypothetical protein OHK0052_26820 [Anaerolineales bacterium]
MKNLLLTLILLTQALGYTVRLERVDSTAFPAVSIRLSAWDENGLPLTALQAADFTLQEDGGAPFHPQQVLVDARTPLNVALLLDVSGSMDGKPLQDAKTAAARFLDRLTSGDSVALLAFNETLDPAPASLNPKFELPFGKDLKPYYDLVEGLESGGGTPLYEAVAKAAQLFPQQTQGRRAALLLSDGRNDPAYRGDAEAALELAKAAQVPFFVIGLGGEIDEPYLRRLAEETGGLYRAAPTSAELAQLFNEMASLLKTQYILSYSSTLPPDGKTHTLSVQVDLPSGALTVERELGPLPAAPVVASTPTVNAGERLAPVPTVVIAVTQIMAGESPTGLPEKRGEAEEPTAPAPADAASAWGGWLLWGGAALLGFVLLGIVWRSRQKAAQPAEEACARCGHDLTGKPGACPQCGDTRRLPKLKV